MTKFYISLVSFLITRSVESLLQKTALSHSYLCHLYDVVGMRRIKRNGEEENVKIERDIKYWILTTIAEEKQ